MCKMQYKKFLINELTRKQISINQENYDDVCRFIESKDGEDGYLKFMATKLPTHQRQNTLHRSTLKNLNDIMDNNFKEKYFGNPRAMQEAVI